jgi:radical SAM superfamily enzyme YgiQ (UPF0313 family)
MARVLFLQNIWFEFLGTMSLLATARRAGHQADLAIGKDNALLRAVSDQRPDVVAFSVVTGYHHWARGLARRIKAEIQPAPLILFGGPHATFFPEIVDAPEVDVVCRGEGEGPLIDILESDLRPESLAGIPNLWLVHEGQRVENPVRPLIQDLDALPFPEREPFYRWPHLRKNPVKRFMSSRGCPYDCAFCFNHSYKALYRDGGRYVRRRSPESLVEELEAVCARYPVKTIRFEDDLFGADRNWLHEFIPLYRRRVARPFICSLRADLIDEEIVRELKRGGCINVVFGIETGSERLRNEVLRKQLSDEQIHRSAAILRRHKLRFCTTNILGLPGETLEDAVATIRMNQRIRPSYTWCSVFQPYPRTRLGEELIASGAVTREDLERIDANYHNDSVLRQPDIRRSVNLHKLFYLTFHLPWLTPLAVQLSKLPPNPVFKLIHRITFLEIFARRWNMSLWRALQEGLRSAGFSRRRSKAI